MEFLTKDSLRKLKRAKTISKIVRILGLWTFVIGYTLLCMAFNAYMLVFIPECGFKTFFNTYSIAFMILDLAGVIAIIPIFIHVLDKGTKFDNKLCALIASSDLSADDLMNIAKEYNLENMFRFALKRRMIELGIDTVPANCKDGYEAYRLPTKEDL